MPTHFGTNKHLVRIVVDNRIFHISKNAKDDITRILTPYKNSSVPMPNATATTGRAEEAAAKKESKKRANKE